MSNASLNENGAAIIVAVVAAIYVVSDVTDKHSWIIEAMRAIAATARGIWL